VTTVVVKRRPRRPAPAVPSGDLPVPPPPEIPQQTAARWGVLLTMLPMLAGTVATAMLFAGRAGGTYSYVVGAVFGVSSLGMLATSFGTGSMAPKKSELMAARREYLRQLAGLRRRVRATADAQRDALHYRHPAPDQLWSTVDSHRLWERRPGDADFGVVRVGVGPQTLATRLVPPVTRPPDELEPTTAGALRGFLDAYSVLEDLPVAVSLRGFARVFVRGLGATEARTGDEAARALVRAMLAQMSVFHAPGDLLIAVCTAPERRPYWDYLKWTPHALHPHRSDAAGPVRLVAASAVELESLLEEVLANRPRFGAPGALGALAGPSAPGAGAARGALGGAAGSPGTAGAPDGPHVVVVLDHADMTGSKHLTSEGGIHGVTIVDLAGTAPRTPERSTIALVVAPDGTLHSLSTQEDGLVGLADRMEPAAAEGLARQLSPLRLASTGTGTDTDPQAETGLADLLGLDLTGAGAGAGAGISPSATAGVGAGIHGWAPRADRDLLRIPIGVGVDGHPVELDLKESAQGGMGPHGLLIGATGSGKSELMRTLTLALAATHDSESLNIVFIDFKGGATFDPFERLPHTAAMITNLEGPYLVDRIANALHGELVRRQELLRRSGNYASLRDYERARAAGVALAPLPVLLIICDEFFELLYAKPDIIDLFVQIGRLGRSLGMHLLLASQRLDEGRLRGLDTHLSYRLCMRTFSALESRAALGVPDAYELPSIPGHGYLKHGTEPLLRFRAAYVSGAYRAAGAAQAPAQPGGGRVLDYSTHLLEASAPVTAPVPATRTIPATRTAPAPGPAPANPTEHGRDGESLLELAVNRLAGAGAPAHQVWLPPLADSPTLDELLGPPVDDPERGITVGNPELRGALQVPAALIDKPFEQRRDLLWLTLSGSAGHVAVVGGPQSGKSTLLCTILCGLSLTHTPREIQMYCLDFGGGMLSTLRDLPHVGGVAGRLDAPAVRRTVGEVATLLADRERDPARERDPDRQEQSHIFLVVDGWSTLRGEYDDLEPVLADLATRGLSYRIHVIASASRWMDFRPGTRDLFGTRLELRLGDPADTLVSRQAAASVPELAPGRGITPDGLHFLAARPTLAGKPGQDAGKPGRDLVRLVASGWSGPKAAPVRLLPALVSAGDLEPGDGLRIPIGLAESDLGTVFLDFAAEPHALLFGDAESGKSGFLRGLASAVAERFAPEQARIIIVDYRRSLLGAITTEHLIGYGTAGEVTADVIESAAGYLSRRLPGPDVTPQQLRDRSWWTGPELFVLVDDYDLVAAGPSNPLLPLLEFLPQARDIGLHLILNRRCGGAMRALYEPIIQRLRELSAPGLILSGSPDEGPLLGAVRPQPLPPGRGTLVTRRDGVRLVQLAYHPPATD
jgi:DNA segregation ATPase FtsK/SpoIIIE, S-DNA-T family